MGDFDDQVKRMLMAPEVGASAERALAIAKKLRIHEIELNDIKHLSEENVNTITTAPAERAKLRRLIETLKAGEGGRLIQKDRTAGRVQRAQRCAIWCASCTSRQTGTHEPLVVAIGFDTTEYVR